MVGALKSQEIDKLLQKSTMGLLVAGSPDNRLVAPVTFVYQEPYLYSVTKDWRKIISMRKSPYVRVRLEQIENAHNWIKVSIKGFYEELKGAEAAKGWRIIKRGWQSAFHLAFDASVPLSSDFFTETVYRIKIVDQQGQFETDLD